MAPSQHTSGTIQARVIAAYSDAELDQYLEEHRLEGGEATVVDVEDPENLPESFVQRLRDRAQRTSDATRSLPIDLDQVNRLLAIPADNNTSPRPAAPPFPRRCSSTLPPTPAEECERERYNDLVKDGGRPLYPISLVDEVAKDPEAYREMLRPWVQVPDVDPPQWDVFNEQLYHWNCFRRWQAHNRRGGRLRCVAVDPDFVYTDKAYNHFVWFFRRESPNYTEAAKNLLAQYDFTRPFLLQDDPKQQDKLTTWIEYLGFACAVHYRYTRAVKVHQPRYDKAWKALVDSKVLRPSETEEYICNIKSAFQRQSEKEQAQQAVKSAEAALVAVQEASYGPRGSRVTSPARAQVLATARTRLDTAKESLKSIERRNELVTTFKRAAGTYLITKEDADRHSAKLRWILEQVPLVEAELNESGATEGRSHAPRGIKRRLTGDRDDEVTKDRTPKKPRGSGQISLLSDGGATPPAPARESSKYSQRDDTADDGQPSKRPRKTRSGGITKTTPRNQDFTPGGTRSRRSAAISAKAATSDRGPNQSKRAPDVPNNPGDTIRRSRRLAGDPPEFGMVRERRGALPLYERYSERPSGGSRRSQQPAKGAKPQGISRSRVTRTDGAKRLAKGLSGPAGVSLLQTEDRKVKTEGS